jgi:hypothetical protein
MRAAGLVLAVVAVVGCEVEYKPHPKIAEMERAEKAAREEGKRAAFRDRRSHELSGPDWQITGSEGEGWQAGDWDVAEEALRLFGHACPGVETRAQHFAWRRARLAKTEGPPAAEYMYTAFGWPRAITAEIKIDDEAEGFQLRDRGHVLWFWIGSGGRPGIRIAPKRAALELCGVVEGRPGRDVFKPVAALAGVLGDAPKGWRKPRRRR